MMTATLDKRGRVTIPRAIRVAAGLKPGAMLQLEVLPTGLVRMAPIEPLGRKKLNSGGA
jgi:AbrB family looped-hinge helix DNA binding protein